MAGRYKLCPAEARPLTVGTRLCVSPPSRLRIEIVVASLADLSDRRSLETTSTSPQRDREPNSPTRSGCSDGRTRGRRFPRCNPPVSPEGEDQLAQVLGLAKEGSGFKPSLVVTSLILRARNTADVLKKSFGGSPKVVVDKCLTPEAKPRDVLKFLSTLKKGEEVVLVSHMPLIFELLHELIGGRGEVELQNGSIAAVGFKGKAQSGKGKLLWLIQPRK